jgi:hypothetical protein
MIENLGLSHLPKQWHNLSFLSHNVNTYPHFFYHAPNYLPFIADYSFNS